MAGVKLVPFGQQAAQQLILRLCDRYAADMDSALAARTTPSVRRRRLRYRFRPARNPVFPIIPFLGEGMNMIKQPLRVGVGGPVGSGKTALLEALCKAMRDTWQLAVVITTSIPKKISAFSPKPVPWSLNELSASKPAAAPYRYSGRCVDEPAAVEALSEIRQSRSHLCGKRRR